MENKSNITDLILELERDENLFDWQIDDIYIWELIRVKLFLHLQEMSCNETYSDSGSISLWKRWMTLFSRIITNAMLRNPFWNSSTTNVLIFESGRKYLFEEKYIDIYTYFIEKKHTQEDKKNITVYETNYLYDRLGHKRKQHIDFIHLFSKLFSKLTASIIGAEDVKRICEIENILKNNTQLDFNLKDLIERELKIFKAQNIFYGKLLDIKRPKVIYLVNYIDYFALLNQARIKKIKTVELQHGLVIKESLIYHFPSVRKDSLQYFPTEYFYWKNFNYNTAKLPLSDGNIIPNEYNHLEYLKLMYKGVLKDEKSILIASQPFYSEKIQEFVLRNLPFMQDYTFYYKLHPMEFNAFETYKNAIKLSTFGNLKIIRNEESIYKLLMRCPYIVGIYSTALFEAEMFGCQPLILRTDGNYTSSLLKEGSGVLIDVDDDLRSCLSGSK